MKQLKTTITNQIFDPHALSVTSVHERSPCMMPVTPCGCSVKITLMDPSQALSARLGAAGEWTAKQILFMKLNLGFIYCIQIGDQSAMIKVILGTLVAVASSINIHQQQTTQTYNSTTYYKQLEARQQRFKEDISLIRAQIRQMNAVLNSSQVTTDEQLKVLEEGMADERDTLYNIQTYLDRPTSLKPCGTTLNLTQSQKQSLHVKIQSVRAALQKLESELAFCRECPQVIEMQAEVLKQYNYLMAIEESVDSGCRKRPYKFIEENPVGLIDLTNSRYKDNLKATNWDYGAMTPHQYKRIIFSLTTQYNRTSCPLSTPYVDSDGKGCMECQGIFLLDKRTCEQCEEQEIWSSSVKKCIPKPIECKPGFVRDPSDQVCKRIECPGGQNYSTDTQKCEPFCKDNQFFNLTSQNCEIIPITCPQGEFYNASRANCQQIACKSNQIFDRSTGTCIVKTRATTGVCPEERPLWKSLSLRCESCPASTPVFNPDFNRCEPCPSGLEWNANSRACQIQCSEAMVLNTDTQKCDPMCLPSRGQVYDNQAKTCKSICSKARKFNITTKQCEEVCESGKVFSQTTEKCQESCSQGQFYNQTTQTCHPCPDGQSFNSTSNKCEKNTLCPDGQLFNATSNKCQLSNPICASGQLYNTTSQQCQIAHPRCPVGQQYNSTSKYCELASPKCPDDQTYNETTKKCNDTVPSCPHGQIYNPKTKGCQQKSTAVCPPSRPVYNYSIFTCESCPANKTYDNSTAKCVPNCSAGYFYNESISNCQSVCNLDSQFYNATLQQCRSRCQSPLLWDKVKQICMAPAEFYHCASNQNWDSDAKKCIDICSTGQIYKAKEQKCVLSKCPHPHMRINQTTNTCYCDYQYKLDKQTQMCLQNCEIYNKFYNAETQRCECPSDQFFDASKRKCQVLETCRTDSRLCPDCPQGLIYDIDNGQCVKQVCPDGYQYNNTTQMCMKCPVQYLYDAKLGKCKLISCKLNQYFNVSLSRCAACPANNFYNITAQKCQKCPKNSVYKPENSRCEACPPKTTYNPVKNTCQEVECPAESYFDPATGQCHKCPAGYRLNFVNLTCLKCPVGKQFDNSTQQCRAISCPYGQYYSRTLAVCSNIPPCKKGGVFSPAIQMCVHQLECQTGYHYNVFQKNCVPNPQCQDGFYYNITESRCSPYPDCPQHLYFSPSLRECVRKPSCSFRTYFNVTSEQCQAYPSCKDQHYFNERQNICVPYPNCPIGQYFDGSSLRCQKQRNCQAGYYFDTVQQECITNPSCSSGQYFNVTQRRCLPYPQCPAGQHLNMGSLKCQKNPTCQSGQYYSQKSKSCVGIPTCPEGTKFIQQTQECLEKPRCRQDEYLDDSSWKCMPIPTCSSGEHFDDATKRCEKIPYLTNPSSPNLIYAYDFSNYTDSYRRAKEQNPAAEDCPNKAPYYNSNIKECVICTKEYPYFNLNSNYCQKCSGSGYDEKKRKCKVSSVTVDPTLQRLIMNIL